MASLAAGQTAMQETMRQLIQTVQGGAPALSGQQSIHRNTHLPSSRTRRTLFPNDIQPRRTNSRRTEGSDDPSYQPGRTSSVRATNSQQNVSLTPERASALERLSRVPPFVVLLFHHYHIRQPIWVFDILNEGRLL